MARAAAVARDKPAPGSYVSIRISARLHDALYIPRAGGEYASNDKGKSQVNRRRLHFDCLYIERVGKRYITPVHLSNFARERMELLHQGGISVVKLAIDEIILLIFFVDLGVRFHHVSGLDPLAGLARV